MSSSGTLLGGIIVLLMFALLMLVGVVMVWVAWRGRRIDDHPLCRKCGFDLTARSSDRCPECGADLAAARAIRIGHRRRRPVLLAFGLVPLLAGLGIVSLIGVRYVPQVGIDSLKPTWLLVREARDPSMVSAWDELNKRLTRKTLSPETTGILVDRVLAWQGDPNRAWQPRWGDFVEVGRMFQQVSDGQWKKYARQAPQVTLELRKQVRVSDDIPAWIRSANARVGQSSNLFRLRITDPTHSGELTKPPPRSGGYGHTTLGIGRGGSSASGHTIQLDRTACAAAATGVERTARVSVDLAVLPENPGTDDDKTEPLARWRQDLEGGWTLVDDDAQTVQVIEDQSLRPAVEKALSSPRVIHQRWGKSEYLRVDLRSESCPVPLAYEAFVRDADAPPGGREWKLSRVTFNSAGSSYSGVNGRVEGFTARRIDLILRPSIEAARNTIEVTRMWNGEVVLKGLPVTRDESWKQK